MRWEKNAGADAGPDGAAAPEGDRGARVVAGSGGVAGGVPHPPQRGRSTVPHQDLVGPAQGGQTPSAVELVPRQRNIDRLN